MSRARLWVMAGFIVLSMVLAFVLRRAMYNALIVPVSYVLWVLGLVYWAVPELIKWIFLVVLAGGALAWNCVPDLKPARRRIAAPERTAGPVQSLAGWISRARKSNYFRWQLANRLGRLARHFEGSSSRRAATVDCEPAISAYLSAGVDRSFVDFPIRRGLFQPPVRTPLDLEPTQAVQYIEKLEADQRGDHT